MLDILFSLYRINNLTENQYIKEETDKIINMLKDNKNMNKKGLKAIIAHNKFGFIGLNGELPWKSKADLKHFKELTNGGKLLVGYNTSLKLPKLPGREIVVDNDFAEPIDPESCDWCIGGKLTYEKYCHLFTELHVSIINDETIGDTLYPDFRNLNPDCKIAYYNFDAE